MLRNIFSVQNQFWVLAILGVVITIVAFRLIPPEFIRMMGLWIMRIVYRSRIIHQDRIPEDGRGYHRRQPRYPTETLSSSPSSVRAPSASSWRRNSWPSAGSAGYWNYSTASPSLPGIPVNPSPKPSRPSRPGSHLHLPGGQLTHGHPVRRTGRGLEMLAKKSSCPIIPIYMDELWGSIFSYSGNRFFSRPPSTSPTVSRRPSGEPIAPDAVNPPMVINTLRELSSTCLEIAASIGRTPFLNHLEHIGHKPLVTAKNTRLTGYEIAECLMNDTVEAENPELRKWLATLLDCSRSQSRLCDFWMNAQQLERVNALQPRELLLTSVGHEEVHETVAAVLWPILTGTPVYLIGDGDHSMPEGIRQIAGSDFLRRRLYSLVPETRTPV